MNIIVCLDNSGGMLFNNRRQSQDSCLRKRLLAAVGKQKLWMNAYSFKQFAAENAGDTIQVAEDFLKQAGAEDYCFVENTEMQEFAAQIEKIIIYKWNRDYPADCYFPLALENWKLVQSAEFAGSSHEKITEEVYMK